MECSVSPCHDSLGGILGGFWDMSGPVLEIEQEIEAERSGAQESGADLRMVLVFVVGRAAIRTVMGGAFFVVKVLDRLRFSRL